jgi:putative two-component system response regulator
MKTVFIVDDSDTNLATAEEALEDHFRVLTLPSAEKMFALLEKVTPDLILLDIEMPEMNGFEALERLKSGKSSANIPVFFLTGTIDASIQEKSAKLGAVGIIPKPFSSSSLLEKINSYI